MFLPPHLSPVVSAPLRRGAEMPLALLLTASAAIHHVTTVKSHAVNPGAANQPAATGALAALQSALRLLQVYLDPKKEQVVYPTHPVIPALAVQHSVDSLWVATFQVICLMDVNPWGIWPMAIHHWETWPMDARLSAACLAATGPWAINTAAFNLTPLPWVVGIILTKENHEDLKQPPASWGGRLFWGGLHCVCWFYSNSFQLNFLVL